jgi:DNA-binding NarL/FixJ family response regulator
MSEVEHILLADDEEDFLHMTATLLRREGYQCACASDAHAAARLLHEEAYDLLITDIKMPGNHNLKLVEDFSCSTNGAPVIVMTGYPEIQSAVRAVQLPVVAYLIKPFAFNDLLMETRQALARAASKRGVNGVAGGAMRPSFSPGDAQHSSTTMPPPLPLTRFAALLGELQQHLSGCLSTVKQLSETLELSRDMPVPTLANLRSAPLNRAAEREKDWMGSNEADMQPSRLQTVLSVLSPREREVLNRLCANQRVSMIARALYISPHTVRNHLKSIFRKLDVKSQVELLTWLGQDSLDP